MENLSLQRVATAHTPFREKFGIPRQPGLLREIPGRIELVPPFNRAEAVRGLDGFSHLWLLFGFHAVPPGRASLTVRPPRLGGNRRVGVFASRSTHRPNPLGLSVVELVAIEKSAGRLWLEVRGLDLLDGTPVYDIKPYLPYVDAVPEASAGYAVAAPDAELEVRFSPAAERACRQLAGSRPQLRRLIAGVVAQDPRPAFKADEPERIYGMRLYDLNVRWRVGDGCAEVVELAVEEDKD